MSPLAPLAVYIHWPYCARICPYCDFNVVRDRGQAEQARLVDAIIRDMEAQAVLTGPRRLTSVFLGGGTPSLMAPDWAAQMIEAARRLWPAGGAVEITLEANPTDAETGRFAAFAAAGVERLSLGVQSINDANLRFLGRNHGAQEARRALDAALKAFPRVSLDLIYALPGQAVETWAEELAWAAASGAEHISPYQLTIETGTAFDRRVRRGVLRPVESDLGAAFYETTQAVLEGSGFTAYEVSNHARGESAQSVHNLAYWRGWDYVGVGPGAHGRLSQVGGRLATQAEQKIAAYIARVEAEGVGFAACEALSLREAAIERLLSGLRCVEGVPLIELAALTLNERRLADHLEMGLIRVKDGRIIATMAGRAVLDRITADLID